MTRPVNKYYIYLRNLALMAMAVLIASGHPLACQEMPVPVSVQFPLFMKILTFDRNINRFGTKINFYIVYQSNYRTSLNIKNEIFQVTNFRNPGKIQNAQVSYIGIDLSSETIENAVSKYGKGVLYITPLRAVDIADITKFSQRQNMITLTGVPDYLRNGVSVAIDTKGNKPEIMINLPATKAEGSDFSSQLLKLSTIIQ